MIRILFFILLLLSGIASYSQPLYVWKTKAQCREEEPRIYSVSAYEDSMYFQVGPRCITSSYKYFFHIGLRDTICSSVLNQYSLVGIKDSMIQTIMSDSVSTGILIRDFAELDWLPKQDSVIWARVYLDLIIMDDTYQYVTVLTYRVLTRRANRYYLFERQHADHI